MRIEIQLRIVADDNSVISEGEILHLDKGDDRLEVIGLSFDEAKAALVGIQGGVVTAQAASFLARHRSCDLCGSRLLSKGPGQTRFRTAFGTIALSSPRFHRCRCQPGAARTFSPLNLLLTERMAPELLYLETCWASLVSYGMTADLLKDVLPIDSTADASTVRRHLHKVAARHDADLRDGQLRGLDAGKDQPLPQAAVVVGIDGGYVRNWYDKKRNFEIVVGKSMAANCNDRCFGFVRSQDEQPERRFRNVLRSQGLPVSQTVTMLTDGGDSVRALVGELSPSAVTMLDWFHIAMRLTGLEQYARGLAHHNPVEALALQHRLERIQWRLWHGDSDEAVIRAQGLAADVAALNTAYPGLKRLIKATAGLATYIANNAAAIVNYSKRWRKGERISTAFVESTVNRVISRRFAKKQQMQWSKLGTHRLLQTRTKTCMGLFSVKHFLIQVFSGSIPMFDQRNHPSVPTMMLARHRQGRRSRMAVRPPPQAARSVLEVRPRRCHPRRVGRGSAGADRAAGSGRLFQSGALASGGSAANQAIRQTCMRSGGGRATMMLYAHRMRGSREDGTILSIGLAPMIWCTVHHPPRSRRPTGHAGQPCSGVPGSGTKRSAQAALSTMPSGSTPPAA
ncbi:hypothetical protein SAE02_75380 [Skermanella aerolata]|uniref:ISKra4 family transposase n=1 Tax=Skermanella aerolata TaxID=393310 RepID=A0A512E4I7_9PROT|nr:ISKra4 family transposase [Skermanella aerolata]GEO43390.1 hypothetical protein SAE02_75380 [Skermanella aerolata]